MNGLNSVALTGNVGNVEIAETKTGCEAATFTLAIQKRSFVTWARVNVYGTGLVGICRAIQKGDKVSVRGELMNRKVAGGDGAFITEIRCQSINLI